MEIPLRTAYGQNGRCGMQPKAKHSLRAQAHQSKSRTETVKTETLEKNLEAEKEERESQIKIMAASSSSVIPTLLAHADNQGEEHPRGAPLQMLGRIRRTKQLQN
ncbi:hypothetical protein TNCV_4031361 [Trichonephila clavipes]|nr:hypothetical protein TNCV_4031361 [Trichonephila clavipes]